MLVLRPWTVALLVLILLDSIITSHIGMETNPLIIWTMKTFDLTLNQAMVARILYCLPLVVLINHMDFGKITVLCYIAIYVILVGLQGLI
jgi:hypothetical protein